MLKYSKKYFGNILLFLLIPGNYFPQSISATTSYRTLFEDHKIAFTDTAYINRLNTAAYGFRRIKPDTAFYLANNALKYSVKAGYQKGIGNAYLTLGYTHLINYSRNDSASIYILRAYDIFKRTKDYFGMGLAYFGMAYVYSFKSDLSQSEKYLQECLVLFNKAKNLRGIYNTYNSLAYIYQQYKDYQTAYDYIRDAIKTATLSGDTGLIADGNNSLGNIYKDQFLFQQAIDIYFKALNLWELTNDSNGLAIAYGNIGLMYYYLQDYDKALEYYKKKLPLSIRAKNSWEVSRTYNHIGLVYSSQSTYKTALEYYRKGLQLNMMMDYMPGMADSYYNIASTYYYMSVFDSAYFYVQKSSEIAKTINAKAKLAANEVLSGRIKMGLGDDHAALQNILKGYGIAKELNIPEEISEASELLSDLYARLNRYDKAYRYLNEFKAMQDSISRDENIKKITRLELQYQFDKKERKIEYEQEQERQTHRAELGQQRLYLAGALVVIFFLVLSGVLIIRQKNLKMKLKTIDIEQRLLRVQMNPHFIFNSLCAIQDYVLSSQPDEANAFLSKFAVLMRSILESSRKDYIRLETEVQILRNYVEIQKLRFETDFNFTIDIDGNIDPGSVAIPPMMTQPFIENAIEHGLLPMNEKGNISLTYQQENGLIRIVLTDNGIGRKNARNLQTNTEPERESLATLLTRERIAYLKKFVNRKSDFSIIDIENPNHETGTKVILTIPCRQEIL